MSNDLTDLADRLAKVDINAAMRLARGACPRDGRPLDHGRWLRWCRCGFVSVLHRRREDSGKADAFVNLGPFTEDTNISEAIAAFASQQGEASRHSSAAPDFATTLDEARRDLVRYGEFYTETGH